MREKKARPPDEPASGLSYLNATSTRSSTGRRRTSRARRRRTWHAWSRLRPSRLEPSPGRAGLRLSTPTSHATNSPLRACELDFARDELDERRLDERRRDEPPFRSAAGISSRATAFASCSICFSRNLAIRSSSRLMPRASLAVSLSPTVSRERLDARVEPDLLELVVVLGPGVLQHLLGLARAAERVERALRRGHGLAGHGRQPGGRLGDHVRAARDRAGLGLAAELLDAALDLAGVALGLLQMLLQALLVGRLRGHGDVGLERCLELLLLAIGLVQVLDQLRVPGVDIRHRFGCLLQGGYAFCLPGRLGAQPLPKRVLATP